MSAKRSKPDTVKSVGRASNGRGEPSLSVASTEVSESVEEGIYESGESENDQSLDEEQSQDEEHDGDFDEEDTEYEPEDPESDDRELKLDEGYMAELSEDLEEELNRSNESEDEEDIELDTSILLSQAIASVVNGATHLKYYAAYKKCLKIFMKETEEDKRLDALLALKTVLEGCKDPKKIQFVGTKSGKSSLEVTIKMLTLSVTSFMKMLNSGRILWHAMEHVEFMGNALIELFVTSLDSGATGAVLGALIGNATKTLKVPIDLNKRTPTTKGQKLSNKEEAKLQESMSHIHRWSFIYCMRICIAVINVVRIKLLDFKIKGKVLPNADVYNDMLMYSYPISNILKTSMLLKSGTLPILPFRLHVLRLLVSLQNCSQLYIPLTMPLIEALSQVSLMLHKSRPPKDSSNKGILYNSIKVTVSDIGRTDFADDCWDHIVVSTTMYFAHLSLHPSFPDVIEPVIRHFKTIQTMKNIPVKCSKRIQAMATIIRESSAKVERIREDIDLDKIPSGMLAIIPFVYPKYKTDIPIYKEYLRALQDEKEKLANLQAMNLLE